MAWKVFILGQKVLSLHRANFKYGEELCVQLFLY